MHRHICAEIDFDCFLLQETLIPPRKLVVIASSSKPPTHPSQSSSEIYSNAIRNGI